MPVLTIIALLFLSLSLSVCGEAALPSVALDRELRSLVQKWEGDYAPDSVIQGPIRPYVLVREVALPAFGDKVVYMEIRDSTRDGRTLRQRVFAFDTAADRSINRITAYDFWDEQGAPYAGAFDDPTKLSGLTPADMYSFPEECDIRWRQDGNTYVGEVNRERCHIPSRTRGVTVSVDMVFGVSDAAFTQWEVGYGPDGALVFGNPDDAPIRSNRVGLGAP